MEGQGGGGGERERDGQYEMDIFQYRILQSMNVHILDASDCNICIS